MGGGRGDILGPAPTPVHTIAEMVSAYAEHLEHVRARQRVDVRAMYRAHLRHLAIPLAEADHHHLQAWVDAVSRARAATTAHNLRGCLARAWRWAYLSDRTDVPDTVTRRLILPPKRPIDPERTDLELLEVEHVSALLSCPRIPIWRRTLWGCLTLTGARPGEVAELRWGDIRDAQPLRALVIARSWQQKTGDVTPRKTGQTVRVPVHPALEELLEGQAAWLTSIGRPPGAPDLICPRPTERVPVTARLVDGRLTASLEVELGRWRQKTVQRWLGEDARLAGLPDPGRARTVRALRASFATLLPECGVDPRTAEAMTHAVPSDGSVWASTYRRVRWATKCQAILALPVRLEPEPDGQLELFA